MSINRGTFDHGKLATPSIVGPGAWKTLHLLAVWDDMNGQSFYSGFIRFYCQRFKCKECGGHCAAFINKHPPEKRVGEKWGMSRHSFDLHNAANKALGKPQLSWEEFEFLFIEEGNGVCQVGCGGNGANGDKKTKKVAEEKLASANFDNIKRISYDDPTLVYNRTEGNFSAPSRRRK